jgi:uncharacterized protein YggU (UPF0235/DUF167 family)
VEVESNGEYRVYLTARAVDGKANRAVLVLLAQYLGIPKSRISIARGATSRHKAIDVDCLEEHEMRARLAERARGLGHPTTGLVH